MPFTVLQCVNKDIIYIYNKVYQAKLFFKFPTISIIYLINIDKYYKMSTFLLKVVIFFKIFPKM